ncbi:MAG: RecX family transcriptional regulator [Bacteroidales bacterium]|nr:RecX family transcriptional regulator [Bacteroidales bacterium]
MERFCAWQERCENDVRRKLASFSLSDSQENAIVKMLKENRFVDDERFVESFVRSKVKASWGRQKIVAALRAKRIPSALIEQYCAQIPAEDYQVQLRSAIEKWQRLHPNVEHAREKLIRHLLTKGYGMGEILKILP